MKWLENLNALEMDITSYCNAACPSCRRTHHLHSNELELTHFSLDTWKRLWTEDLIDANITKLVLNGNWGDSMMHKDILEMLEYPIKHNPNIKLMIDTNGGMRREPFWESFAEILNSQYKNPIVRFGIDGTDNYTNGIYRVDVLYDQVLRNAGVFIEGGGIAQWRFTVFDHNVHQIHDAHDIAERMGFEQFKSRKSYARRIYAPGDKLVATTYCYDSMKPKDIFIHDKFPNRKFHKGYPYVDPPYQESKCIWYRENRIQIDPYGNIWPCCHISGLLMNTENLDIKLDSWNKYGFKHNNINHRSLGDILQDSYFTKEIPNAVDEARWKPCRDICGVQK